MSERTLEQAMPESRDHVIIRTASRWLFAGTAGMVLVVCLDAITKRDWELAKGAGKDVGLVLALWLSCEAIEWGLNRLKFRLAKAARARRAG